jgi:hypothetical protein
MVKPARDGAASHKSTKAEKNKAKNVDMMEVASPLDAELRSFKGIE